MSNVPPKGHLPADPISSLTPYPPTMAFVPMRRIEISGEVTGPVAGMQVVHVFSYTNQQCRRVIEAAYRFPLQGDAAVTGVSVRFGDVEIQAVLEPRAARGARRSWRW